MKGSWQRKQIDRNSSWGSLLVRRTNAFEIQEGAKIKTFVLTLVPIKVREARALASKHISIGVCRTLERFRTFGSNLVSISEVN
jgi:hypothetical protein